MCILCGCDKRFMNNVYLQSRKKPLKNNLENILIACTQQDANQMFVFIYFLPFLFSCETRLKKSLGCRLRICTGGN